MRGLVATVYAGEAEAAERALAQVPGRAAGVEIRADRLRPAEAAGLVRRSPKPAIVTVRAVADGGSFTGSAEEKRAILEAALAAGAAFVDVEWDGPLRAYADGPSSARVVLSHHGAPCDAGLDALFEAMAATRAARLKIVPRARRAAEIAAVRALLARARARGRELAAFALGVPGIASRVLALPWGSWATYGAAAGTPAAGDGQRTAREMIEVFRCDALTASSVLYGLVGSPVGESPSPAVHAAGYAAAGLDAAYLPLETAEASEAASLPGLLGLAGLAVTVPLKTALAVRCARLDPSAACGAVNTVRVAPSGWEGSNTDAPAALALVRRWLDPAGADVAILGAGGAARAIGAALVAAGARVTLYARDAGRASATAAAIGAAAATGAIEGARWDLLVQATPLGRGGEEAVPESALPGRMVLDCVYARSATPLVAAARRAGLAVADGYDLLHEQALRQFEILTGRAAPVEAMRAALASHREASDA